MMVLLNGKPHEAPAGAAVLALLESIGLTPGRVAVEVNGRVIGRDEFARMELHEGDRVEVVQFVGGG
jgi:thiamine biosynthesis protein ThiS